MSSPFLFEHHQKAISVVPARRTPPTCCPLHTVSLVWVFTTGKASERKGRWESRSLADRVRSIHRYCLWNTLRSFHGDSWVAGTRAYKPEGDSQWIDDLGWVAFLLPSEGSQMPWVPPVTHGPRLIRLPFLPRTNLYSLLLLNNSFPDTGAPGCHPRLKPTQTMLCILESPGRFLFSFGPD